MKREKMGRVAPASLSEEHKASISRGQRERHLRSKEDLGPPPGSKICSKCKSRKRVPEDFPMRKRKLASGGVTVYPAGECKECAKRRRDEWWAGLSSEQRSEYQRKWNKGRDASARRAYQREYGRETRAMRGVGRRGAWRKYKHEVDHKVMLDAVRFRLWLVDKRDRWALEHAEDDVTAMSGGRAGSKFGVLDDFLAVVGMDAAEWKLLETRAQRGKRVELELVDKVVHALLGSGVEFDAVMGLDELMHGSFCKLPKKPKPGRKGWV